MYPASDKRISSWHTSNQAEPFQHEEMLVYGERSRINFLLFLDGLWLRKRSYFESDYHDLCTSNTSRKHILNLKTLSDTFPPHTLEIALPKDELTSI
ncbi:hypothetical protein E1B28_006870 [Marasmius oreades]|uniref:Uncharacterized protein n=1 Tax=Marasmius oreades TaxID=181124 RepID=A0A9P7UUC3_9AGAR|nr:uncharacterized protein E1B28_006870 [Marasmius oreades]KAG7093181.1 hypothetical protein E1B28_006870 [Marasmius oreades]